MVGRHAAGGQPRSLDARAYRCARRASSIHAARQDLEAIYLTSKQVVSPVFDTQIAAACIGLKPQVGYAELVKTLLDVRSPRARRAPTGRCGR